MELKKYFKRGYLKNGIRRRTKLAFDRLGYLVGFRLSKIEKYPAQKWNGYKLKGNPALNTAYQAGQSIKLHFGCGPRVLKGWINIDLHFEPYEKYLMHYKEHYSEEIRGTIDDFYAIDIITQGLSLPDNSVDCVFHEDFFEHLNQRDQLVFLAETLRVMKKGAVHRINTPNLVASMRDNSHFEKGKDGVFVEEWNNWHHYNLISPTILGEMAKIVGYADITFNTKNESIIKHQLPLEYRPNAEDRLSADSNVFADLTK